MNIWHRFRQWLTNGFDIISASIKALSGDPLAWESTIQKFEAHDRVTPPPPLAAEKFLQIRRSFLVGPHLLPVLIALRQLFP